MASAKNNLPRSTSYVTVRFWPGFKPSFPFSRVDDNVRLGRDLDHTEQELRRLVAAEAWRVRCDLRARRQVAYSKWVAGMRKQSKQVLGPPATKFAHRTNRTARSAWRQTHGFCDRRKRFWRLAQEIGWATRLGFQGESIISPRICVATVDQADLAANLVIELEVANIDDHLPQNLKHFFKEVGVECKRFMVPRFQVLAAARTEMGEQASLIRSLSNIETTEDQSIWGMVARSYLPIARAYISSWHSVITSPHIVDAVEGSATPNLNALCSARQQSPHDPPEVQIGGKGARIAYGGLIFVDVPVDAARALQAIVAGGGSPVGISTIVGRKAKEVIQQLPDELQKLVAPRKKQGYVYLPLCPQPH